MRRDLGGQAAAKSSHPVATTGSNKVEHRRIPGPENRRIPRESVFDEPRERPEVAYGTLDGPTRAQNLAGEGEIQDRRDGENETS